jgi:ABC-type thiamin/hydroxymethylpyrimidine transport system permease subunit
MGRAVLSFGLFILLGSVWMLLIHRPGSSEFVVSMIAAASGAVLVGSTIILARRNLRHALHKEDK